MALTHWSGGDMRGGSENTSRLGYQWEQRKCSAGGGLKVLAASLALNVPWQQVLRSTVDGMGQASIKAPSCLGIAPRFDTCLLMRPADAFVRMRQPMNNAGRHQTAADQRESCNDCASLMANGQSRSAFNRGSG